LQHEHVVVGVGDWQPELQHQLEVLSLERDFRAFTNTRGASGADAVDGDAAERAQQFCLLLR
jgi:hypothetical protein